MPHLLYPVESEFFHRRIVPALGNCWKERSFEPGRELFRELEPRIAAFHAECHGITGKTLIEEVATGLAFDRLLWRTLVGEVLLIAAAEMPILELSPEALCVLLLGASEGPRSEFSRIEQVLYGSRDLVFRGGFYRPDFAGWNDVDDVARLAEYLQSVDVASWQPGDLRTMAELPDDEERFEELEFVRQNWPGLVQVYVEAKDKRRIIICDPE